MGFKKSLLKSKELVHRISPQRNGPPNDDTLWQMKSNNVNPTGNVLPSKNNSSFLRSKDALAITNLKLKNAAKGNLITANSTGGGLERLR